MRQLIAVGVVLMLTCLGGLFAWFASAIRRDSRERFQRVQQRVEVQAGTIVGKVRDDRR